MAIANRARLLTQHSHPLNIEGHPLTFRGSKSLLANVIAIVDFTVIYYCIAMDLLRGLA